MNVAPWPAGRLFLTDWKNSFSKKSWIENFRFFRRNFQISYFKISDFRFQNFQISDFKIFRFQISKLSKSSSRQIKLIPVPATPSAPPCPCGAVSSKIVFFDYQTAQVSRKNNRHSESPCVTHQSPSVFILTKIIHLTTHVPLGA